MSGLLTIGWSSDEESDESENVCTGPEDPFNRVDWVDHEHYHQITEGRYRNVEFHASTRHPTVSVVTKNRLCPISCFYKPRHPEDWLDPPDETKLFMTCHVATLDVGNYRSLQPEAGDIRSPPDYLVNLKAAFEPKKREIQEELTQAKGQPGIEDMNIHLRAIITHSSLSGERGNVAEYTQALTTNNLARVEETIGPLFDECVNFLLAHIENIMTRDEPCCSFTFII